MNLKHLALFVRVAATQNISQAGDALGLSPAVASAHLNKLEQTLGVKLLHRTTRSVSLTCEGRAFLHHAEEVLNSVEAAKASVGASVAPPEGTLRVVAPTSFGRMHLLSAINAFIELYPRVKIDLRLSDTLVDLVEGGFDVAIRNTETKDPRLVAQKLTKDTRIVCASPAYLSRYGKPNHPSDLKLHNCITLTATDNWVFKDGGQTISVKAKGNFTTNNNEATRDACAEGLGITINSLWSAYQHLANEELIEVLSDYPLTPESNIWLVYPSSRQLTPKVRTFVDFLLDYCGDTPYWEDIVVKEK